MKRILFAALIAGAWANSAIAEDYDWSGIYGGVSVGARWSDVEYDPGNRMPIDYWSTSGTGFTGGGFVGYNFVYDRLVFGPDVSIMFSDADSDAEPEISGSYRGQATMKTNGVITANMRLGYSFGRVLPFFTAGYGKAWYARRHSSQTIYEPTAFTENLNRTGWNIGGGADVALTDHLFARAEYRYLDFGKEEIYGSYGWSRTFKQHAATLGIGYKF